MDNGVRRMRLAASLGDSWLRRGAWLHRWACLRPTNLRLGVTLFYVLVSPGHNLVTAKSRQTHNFAWRHQQNTHTQFLLCPGAGQTRAPFNHPTFPSILPVSFGSGIGSSLSPLKSAPIRVKESRWTGLLDCL